MTARGRARFLPATVKKLREAYHQTCAICLKSLTSQGSECAHLFPAARQGEMQVNYYVELGLLDSSYRRDGKENGVVFCPTCHREYFTQPIVALSPPVHILRKILSTLQNKSDGDLSTNDDVFRSAAKGSYANLYCLVALPSLQDSIPPGARSEILTRVPPKSVLKDAKWLQDVAPQTGDTTAFIMDVENAGHDENRPFEAIPLMPSTSEEYLWRLPIPLKVVLAVLIQASISIMSISPGEEIILAQEIHLLLRRSVHSVPRILNAHTSGRDSEPGTNDDSHSLSGLSPPPPLLFGAAAPVIIKNFKFEFQYVLEPHEASEVGATGHTLPIQGSYRSSDEIPYTAEGAMLACGSMLPALVTQLATLKVGSPMRKHVWRNYITRLTEPKKVVTRIALRGPTGAGKSSLINALLGAKIVPTSGAYACTATPIEVSYHEKATIQAEIHFVSREEWLKDLRQLRDDIRDFSDEFKNRVEIAWSKVHAVYPAFKYMEQVKTATVTKIAESDPDISKLLGASISVVSDGPIQFAGEIRKYVAEMNHSRDEPSLWPLIKRVDIRYKCPTLENGVVLVDLPGDADTNAARNSVSQRYNKECEYLWIVTPATRAVNDATAKSILDENFRADVTNGRYHDDAITLIASKCDDVPWEEIIEDLQLEQDTELVAIQSDMDRTADRIGQLDKLLAADGGPEEYRELRTLNNQLKQLEQDRQGFAARKRSEFIRQQLRKIARKPVGVQGKSTCLLAQHIKLTVSHQDEFPKFPVFTCSSLLSQVTSSAAGTDESQIPLLRDHCRRLAEAAAERKAQSLMEETWNFVNTVHKYARGRDAKPGSEEARATLEASWDSRTGDDVYSRLRAQFSQPEQGLKPRLVRALCDVQETIMGRISEQLDALSLDKQSERAIKRTRETARETVHQFFDDMHSPTLKAVLRREGTWEGDDLNIELLNPFKKRIAFLWAKFCDFDAFDELDALALVAIQVTLSAVEKSAKPEIRELVAEQVSFCMSEARVSLSELLTSIRHNVKRIRGKLRLEIVAHVKTQLRPAYSEALLITGSGSKERQILFLCDYLEKNDDKIFGGLSQILTSWVEKVQKVVSVTIKTSFGELSEKMEVNLATLWEDADDDGNSEQVEARKAVSATAAGILKQLDLWKEASGRAKACDTV